MSQNIIFDSLYNKLNTNQKEAVDTIEGPVMVIAGPGTGKTQILTLRIANILRKTDTSPENILALTFTESGAYSMRKRLTEIIGTPAYSVEITTFHSFCNDVIKKYPENFSHIIGSNSITDIDQIKIIDNLIDNLDLKKIKPFGNPKHYLKAINTAISNLKREGVSPKKFQDILDKEQKYFDLIDDLYNEKGAYKGKMKDKYQKLQANILKNKELAEVYFAYQNELQSQKVYDYNDMIIEVLNALSTNQELLLALQENYQYLLIDEHQDTNNAQNKILELLSNFHLNPNIFIVGDQKQAIYRFQGASLENFLYFKNLYAQAKLIILEQNYRSTQAILDLAHSLIASDQKLKSNTSHPENKIKLFAFSKLETEAYFLAKDIEEKLTRGVNPSEIAILYRENRDVFQITPMLEKFSIPFSIESDQNILTDNDIKKIILVLKTINSLGSQDLVLEAMHIDFLEINPLDIYKIIEFANSSRQSAFSIINSTEILNSLKLETAENIFNFYKKLVSFKTLSKNKSLLEFFEIVIRESGFLNYILSQPSSIELIDKLNSFFDEIKELIEIHKDYGLNEFLEYIEMLQAHDILIKKSPSLTQNQRVRLMTAHKSKGQEFEYVYIINAFNKHWGNKRKMELLKLPAQVFSLSQKIESEEDQNNDERRLFYVALTRAKKEITITYAKENISKKEQLPSQFLSELNQDLIENKDTTKYENEFNNQKEVIFKEPVIISQSIKDKEFVKELFQRNGLSITALNNYLECPWKYFYSNLLRIPKAKNKHQIYGTAVHAALKDFFDAFKEQTPDKEYLLKKFQYYLNREPLIEKEYLELLEKGSKSLSGYYDNYNQVWRTNVITELNISGIELLKNIKLVGKIDKLEFLNNSAEVNVVDYKTSKPKTRGEIEGATQSSEGNEKRQLIFYNLLLNNFSNGKYKMTSGEIDFVEPDEKNRYKKESFIITKDEIAELTEIIKKVSDEIIELRFWDKKCDNHDCQFCQIRDLMS